MKTVMIVKAMALIGLVGMAFGCAQKVRSPEGVPQLLAETREALTPYIDGSQLEMTLVTDFQTKLALMELDYVQYQIENSPGYLTFEAEYMKDCRAWDKEIEAALAAPSLFEGGTLALMDKSGDYCGRILARIATLRQKYLK